MSPWNAWNLFLEMHKNCLVIFITKARTRPGLQGPFSDHDFDFSKLELQCALMKLSGDQDSGEKKNSMFSQRHFTYVKHLPYIVCGGSLVIKSCPTLVTPWTIAHQAPLSVGFPRQEYWSVLPFPSPGDLADPAIVYCMVGNKISNHCGKATVVWGYWQFQLLVLTRWFTNIFPVLFSFSSVQFSHSVVSDSLRPHELQLARPPCPSPTPRVHSDSRPLSQWCHPAISSSVIPFSSCPQSLLASESFPMSQLFHEVAKVLEFQL